MHNNGAQSFPIQPDPKKWKIHWQDSFDTSLLLFITGRCNLNCANCFSVTSRSNQEMTIGQIMDIVKANPTFQKVDLMGGEPLLHPQLSRILRELKSLGKQVSIYTNGILLSALSDEDMPIRACISFHEIASDNPSRKPLMPILNKLEAFAKRGNPLKLVLLLDQWNAGRAMDIVNFVDQNMPYVRKLTLGLMRYENDYWNDEYYGVLPFADYARTIAKILDTYDGRLSLDIFLKGVLEFDGDPGGLPNRTNRFKCVFPDNSYSSCLFTACDKTRSDHLPDSLELPPSHRYCMHTGKKCCLADKVRLSRISEDVSK